MAPNAECLKTASMQALGFSDSRWLP